MNKGLMWLIGIGIALFVIVMYTIGVYNGLVAKDQGVKAAWAQVESLYQRRLDLIPNLVETVNGYKIHEADVMKNIADSRAKLAGAKSVSEKVAATNGMEGAISRLLVVVENYPNLKADANFRALMDSLEGTENRISVERMRYNEIVKEYNITVKRFPTILFVNSFGFDKEKTLFAATKGAETAPAVKF